jgi:hypothetical protein
MKTVLIMGQTPDPHIDSVAHVLRQMGARVLFFHSEGSLGESKVIGFTREE